MGRGYDRRADVYALGCVLYEVLTGRRPFAGVDDEHVIRSITNGLYRPLPEVLGLPAALSAVVERALAFHPADRFHSAEGFRIALERVLFDCKRLVSTSDVAGIVRARLGSTLDRRRRFLLAARSRLPPSRSPSVATPPTVPPPMCVAAYPFRAPAATPSFVHPFPSFRSQSPARRSPMTARGSWPTVRRATTSLGFGLAALATLTIASALGSAVLLRSTPGSGATLRTEPPALPRRAEHGEMADPPRFHADSCHIDRSELKSRLPTVDRRPRRPPG